MFVLTELMIRTGSSLGTNKVFFCCGSHDVDGHDDDCEDLWGFSPESLRLATLISHQGHLKRECYKKYLWAMDRKSHKDVWGRGYAASIVALICCFLALTS